MLFLGRLPAPLALHLAAPVELALALLDDHPPTDDEPPAAAQHAAPVRPRRRPVAPPTRRPCPARLPIGVAEVGRGLEVDEVRGRVGPVDGREVLRNEVGDAGAQANEGDLDGCVEPVTEELTDVAEVRQGLPAGLQLTGTGYAVTLATDLRVVRHSLQTRTKAEPTFARTVT